VANVAGERPCLPRHRHDKHQQGQNERGAGRRSRHRTAGAQAPNEVDDGDHRHDHGDRGHRQPRPVALPPHVIGAGQRDRRQPGRHGRRRDHA
jgi:hypothetical protein